VVKVGDSSVGAGIHRGPEKGNTCPYDQYQKNLSSGNAAHAVLLGQGYDWIYSGLFLPTLRRRK